jgi:hypothetical protein
MAGIYETASLALVNAQVQLPAGAWDLKSFIDNTSDYVKVVGGALLMLMGTVALIAGGIFGLTKLFGNQQHGQGKKWWQIGALILLGGAFAAGGFSLISTIGSGGQKTIEDLGGTIVLAPSSSEATGGSANLPG